MRKILIVLSSLLGISQAVAQTAKELDEISKVAYCYGALTKWQMLHPIPEECKQYHSNSQTCKVVASDANRIDRLIAYLTQHAYASNATFKANISAQEKGETDAENCKASNPGMSEPHCPNIDACLTLSP